MSVDWLGLQPGKNKNKCKFCARAQHVQCAPHVIFLYSAVMPLSRCAEVVSLVLLSKKITISEGPMLKALLPFWHVLLVPFITVYPNEYCFPMVTIGPQSLNRISPLVRPAS